jgi:hypothetical protein
MLKLGALGDVTFVIADLFYPPEAPSLQIEHTALAGVE